MKAKVDDQLRVGASVNFKVNKALKVTLSTWGCFNPTKTVTPSDDIFPISLRFDVGQWKWESFKKYLYMLFNYNKTNT